jgi:hypothetical protein
MGGVHAEAEHIKIMQDCAQICATSVEFMIRESNFHNLTCAVCAEICISCAESCDSLTTEKEMMQECIDSCRKCAASCEEMSKMQ